MAFIRSANSTFHCHNPKSLKLITRLRLGLSHLRFYKFKHSFQDILNPICNYGTVEPTIHYLLQCPNFSNERLTLFNKLQSTDENILSKDDSNISKGLLFGDHSLNDVKNTCFHCFNWIHNFSKAFWFSLTSKSTLIYLSRWSLFLVFVKKFLVHLFYLVLYFLYLRLLTLYY